MKGVDEKGFGVLAGVLGIIFLTFLVVVGLLNAPDVPDPGDWDDGDLFKKGFENQILLDFDEFSAEERLVPIDSKVTSTEVACKIAIAIRDDFAGEGNAKSGDRPGTELFDTHLELIPNGIGKFRIEWNNEKSRFYRYEDLDDSSKEKLKQSCSNTGEFLPCETEFLDEVCITQMLKNLRPSGLDEGNYLCTGLNSAPEGSPIVAGSDSEFFGNENCGDSDASGKKIDCKTLCPAGSEGSSGKDKLVFKSVGKDSLENPQDIYAIKDDKLHSSATPPKEGVAEKISPGYAWTALWDDKTARYEIHVYRVPIADRVFERTTSNIGVHSGTLDESDPNSLPNIFLSPDRNSIVGSDSAFRVKYNLIVEPAEEVGMKEFVDAFLERVNKKDSGGDWEVVYDDTCVDYESCVVNKETQKQRKLKRIDKNNGDKVWGNDVYDWKTIEVRSPFDFNSDKFEKNIVYQIVLVDYARGNKMEQVNENPGCDDVWCEPGSKKYSYQSRCVDNLIVTSAIGRFDKCGVWKEGGKLDQWLTEYHQGCIAQPPFGDLITGFCKRFDYFKYTDYALVILPVY